LAMIYLWIFRYSIISIWNNGNINGKIIYKSNNVGDQSAWNFIVISRRIVWGFDGTVIGLRWWKLADLLDVEFMNLLGFCGYDAYWLSVINHWGYW
jgi:hypothetical protein